MVQLSDTDVQIPVSLLTKSDEYIMNSIISLMSILFPNVPYQIYREEDKLIVLVDNKTRENFQTNYEAISSVIIRFNQSDYKSIKKLLDFDYTKLTENKNGSIKSILGLYYTKLKENRKALVIIFLMILIIIYYYYYYY